MTEIMLYHTANRRSILTLRAFLYLVNSETPKFCFVILDVKTQVPKVLNNRKKISLGDKLLVPTGQLLQV